jgi:hypothetical protein
MFIPEKDVLYEFILDDGTSLVLRYDGRGGPNQRQIWYEPATGATLDPLPPYTDVQFLGIPLQQK